MNGSREAILEKLAIIQVKGTEVWAREKQRGGAYFEFLAVGLA